MTLKAILYCGISIAIFGGACTSTSRSKSNQQPTPDRSKFDFLTDPLSLQRYSPDDFEKFVDQHYSDLKAADVARLLPKEKYKGLFSNQEEGFVAFEDFVSENRNAVRKLRTKLVNYSKFDFHVFERNKPKTIVLVTMPHVSPALSIRMSRLILEKMSDFNIVLADGFRLFTSEKSLTSQESRLAFKEDLEKFISAEPKRTYYLNVVCFGALVTNEFLRERKDLYRSVVFYAPMVNAKKKGHQVSPNELHAKGLWMHYFDLLSVLFVVTHEPQPFMAPANNLLINRQTFSNLFADYESGLIKNDTFQSTLTIISERDQIVPRENSVFLNAQQQRVLKDADHLTPFYLERDINRYIEYVRDFYASLDVDGRRAKK